MTGADVDGSNSDPGGGGRGGGPRDRDDPAAGAAQPDLQGQRLPDDPSLDAHRPAPHRRGLVGEAYVGDEDAALLEIDRIVHDEIAPRIIGEDLFALERLWQLARPATFDILRDRRLGLVACAGIDTALWDAIGKCLGQPLWRLWGGFRNSIPMISIGGYYGATPTSRPRSRTCARAASPG